MSAATAPGATVEEQMRAIMTKQEERLKLANMTFANVVDAKVYLGDVADFAAMNDAWSRWLPAGCAPARATVEARLASADVRVEIMVTAVRKPA